MAKEQEYFQVSVIPYRQSGGSYEYCLITSTKNKTWGFPKGTIKKEHTPLETATMAAQKEAGVEGAIAEQPVGSFKYLKWEELQEVLVLMMDVAQCHEDWADADRRQRKWVPIEEALTSLAKADHQKLVKVAHGRLTES